MQRETFSLIGMALELLFEIIIAHIFAVEQ